MQQFSHPSNYSFIIILSRSVFIIIYLIILSSATHFSWSCCDFVTFSDILSLFTKAIALITILEIISSSSINLMLNYLLCLQLFIISLGGCLNIYYFKKVKNANALAASVIQVFIVLSGFLTVLNGWSGELTFGLLGAYFVYDTIHSVVNYQSMMDMVFIIHHAVGIYAMHVILTSVRDIETFTVLFITFIEISNFLRNLCDGWEITWPKPLLYGTFPFCKLLGPIYVTTEMFKMMPDTHYNIAFFTAMVFGVITLCDAHITYGEYRDSFKQLVLKTE